jgi:tetratricopeptide (TPR) repeat protein
LERGARTGTWVAFVAAAAALGAVRPAAAQPLPIPSAAAAAGDLTLTEEEITAWQLTQIERYVGARESAERVLAAAPDSVVGHAALGMIQRYGEGNLPRALYHLRRARRELEARFGARPAGPLAIEWHRRILQEAAFTCGEMERFEEELALWDSYDELYDPDMPGERIWPLMMLRRFDDARAWAAKALTTGERWPRRQAMNGLCALENEAGYRLKSYQWCTSHAREIREIPQYGGVFLCNAGEAARGVLRLDEAERYYLEATVRDVEWYANPWMDLSQLYLRAGRLAPAAQAIKSMNEYNRRRPPHTQQQDESERQRAVAAMLIVAGRPEQALPLTDRAVRFPDRRGGQSRSPEADLATNALLHRRALLDAAEADDERRSTRGVWSAWGARLSSAWRRALAFRVGRRVVALATDDELLTGLLEAEGHLSFGTPPWLVPDLVDVLGPGPVEAALARAREGRPAREVPALRAYLDAYEAVAAEARGEWDRAATLSRAAAAELPPGEAILAARVKLVGARVHEARGERAEAAALYIEVLQTDPTLLRRARLRIPVEVAAGRDQLSARTAALLRRSPRLVHDRGAPLRLRVQAEGGSTCHLCFVTRAGAEVGCVTETVGAEGTVDDAARQCADLLHERLLAPRVDRSLLDPASLDGGTTSGDLDELLGPARPGPPGPPGP